MYQTSLPPKHLKKYIDCFWAGEQENNGEQNFSHHAIASSKLELQFHYVGNYVTSGLNGQNEKVFKAGFFGQTNSYKHYLSNSPKTSIFSVRFYPLALLSLFNISATELTNKNIDIICLLGHEGNELTERIFEAKSFLGQIKIITSFIERKIRTQNSKYLYIENLLISIHHTNGRIAINELVAQSFISQRQFERNFKDLTGFSAKEYLKILKFETLIETITYSEKPTNCKLTDIAFEFGYFDQAHLNHHFKEYTGITPTKYFNNLAQKDL